MSWEISMTQEGWENVRINVEYLAYRRPNTLREGIASDVSNSGIEDEETGELSNFDEKKYKKCLRALKKLSPDCLADTAMSLIEQNNTCTNGGFEVYLDDEGYTTIPVVIMPAALKYWRQS
jgi:hypothetical protein